MSHNDNTGGLLGQIPQTVRNHTRLDLGALFHLTALCAVELESDRRLYNHLVAAAAERHLQRHGSQLLILAQRVLGLSDPDTKSGRNPIPLLHLFYLVQDRELLLHERRKSCRLKQNHKLIPFIAHGDTAAAVYPGIDTVLNLPHQRTVTAVWRALDNLIIVIDHRGTNHDLFIFHLFQQLFLRRHIHKIDTEQLYSLLFLTDRNHPPRHDIVSVAKAVFLRAGVSVLDKTAELQIRKDILDVLAEKVFPLSAGHLQKAVVVPLNRTAGGRHRHRRRKIQHGGTGRRFTAKGKLAQGSSQLSCPAAHRHKTDSCKQNRRKHLHTTQNPDYGTNPYSQDQKQKSKDKQYPRQQQVILRKYAFCQIF